MTNDAETTGQPSISIRRGSDRGRANLGWLDSRHTFSFGEYYDPAHMGFRSLRVINDDRVAPGAGFPNHRHHDMEIITYVLSGALEHKDSMGNGSVIRPGDVQRMTAGTGITHSEYNHSPAELVHFLQIWVLPSRQGLPPGYEQKHFDADRRRDRLCLVAAPDGAEDSITVHQDVRIFTARLSAGAAVTHRMGADRHAWVHVAHGHVRVGDVELREGDGLAGSNATDLNVTSVADSEVVLFDLH
ncbi:MAG: pirin family protein [Myxococcales bacterium FL481]|nr:MAG: pirin family protein [Myxococcales bacterium FL481]